MFVPAWHSDTKSQAHGEVNPSVSKRNSHKLYVKFWLIIILEVRHYGLPALRSAGRFSFYPVSLVQARVHLGRHHIAVNTSINQIR